MSDQCKGKTANGEQCNRDGLRDGYCWQHEAGADNSWSSDRVLTKEEEIWVAEYLVTGSAQEAAWVAYNLSNPASASSKGHEVRNRPHVVKAIQAALGADPRVADKTERARLWTEIMRDPNTGPRDRIKAAETLGKVAGDFIDRVEISGKDGGPIELLKQMTDQELEERLALLEEIGSLADQEDDE